MIKIYHNPRCSKSREGLCLLNDLNQEAEVINYIENPLTFDELKKLIALLNISPIELVRTKETIWKEQFKNQNLTDEQIIQAMVDFPKLIERPIVVNGNKAVIARPAEKIKDII
ncbi:MAG TPA: arsenate reductase (glutaredoxin) [Flavobacterium sp.]|jgi:arsenate reductase|nr:arsenate reductase (glutaredoxin) [Flavobacterium sp.]